MTVLGAFADNEAGAITGDSTWVLVFLSRLLNVLTGGSRRELFCARAHREGWAICRHIDALFRVIRADDREHCRACYLGDKRARRLRARAGSPGGSTGDGPETALRPRPSMLA